jgi:hypothetical protein
MMEPTTLKLSLISSIYLIRNLKYFTLLIKIQRYIYIFLLKKIEFLNLFFFFSFIKNFYFSSENSTLDNLKNFHPY